MLDTRVGRPSLCSSIATENAVARLSFKVIEDILMSGRAGPRLLGETALQLKAWVNLADDETKSVDLLLTPHENTSAAALARILHRQFTDIPAERPRLITPMEGSVVATVDFTSFLRVILPATGLDLTTSCSELETLVLLDRKIDRPAGGRATTLPTVKEYLAFASLRQGMLHPDLRSSLLVVLIIAAHSVRGTRQGLSIAADDWPEDVLRAPLDPREKLRPIPPSPMPTIWRVSVNRPLHALGMSIETIKADAAQRVFNVDCRTLTWAVIDSGIDGSHPAFRDHDAGGFATRVLKAYDFSRLRQVAAYDKLLNPAQLVEVQADLEKRLALPPAEVADWLKRLSRDADEGRPYDWEVLSGILEVAVDQLQPVSGERPNGHGTHVAGVLAGDWREDGHVVYQGVCPNLRLFDLRVLGNTSADTEFAVIAALEFVRWTNARNRYMTIHGVNLSIGLVHDLENYACGRTPVCVASEATVNAGVSVIAAAGNWGTQTFHTEIGFYRGYAPMSISDPGNAELVITVGATHRERPHEYGVSFFSSRGPTGDGRNKPDVVAPGERIDGPLPNLGYGRLDGTSMAAPHVSGVAAMLMARNPEMIGDPRRVKAVIVKSATDLGRERHFQGAGLVDALRALQCV